MENRWGKSGNSDRFYFLGLQIAVHSDSTHVIKRSLLLGRKAMTILAQTHIAKGMVFTVVIYRSERWTIKKAECQRLIELRCQKRLLRVPWTASRSNQSISKEINPEYSLEGLMLKLKLQYFGHLMRRTDSLEKTLMLGKTDGKMTGGGRG